MNEKNTIPEFSLFGGPLQRFGARLGLVKQENNTIRLGLALGLLAWGVLVLLAVLEGAGLKLFSFSLAGVHARFLVAIPLFFVCETLVGRRMKEFVHNIVSSGLVPKAEIPAFALSIRKVNQFKDSWLAEIIFVFLVFAMSLLGIFTPMPEKTGNLSVILGFGAEGVILTKFWYLGFCMPLFRFLLIRWVWHLALWFYFLWRVERLKLHLIPTHSDQAGGLGYLEVVHEHFIPLAIALSTVLSASFAEEIIAGSMAFESLYHIIPLVLVIIMAVFIGPLFIFSGELWICRVKGLNEYMAMVSNYAHAFDRKWIRDQKMTGEEQLGSADLQSLADLSTTVNVIRDMQFVPVSRRLLIEFAIFVLLPFLPLWLLKYPFDQLAMKLFQMLAGQ